MPSAYFSFVRIRIFSLAYTSCLSILAFAIVLFVIPTAGKRHAPALAVIAVVSLIVGLATCSALVASKTQCCVRRSAGVGGKMYVGIEALLCAACSPLLATAIVLEAGLSAPTRNGYGSALDGQARRTLSALLLVFSCNSALVLVPYTGLVIGLATYTQSRTQRTNIWFADAASLAPAFVFPLALRFLRTREDADTADADTERTRRSQRVRIEQLDVNPTLLTLLRQIRLRERSRHTLAPDCACGEKPLWAPTQPDEYRAVGQVYARVWTVIAEREAQARARALSRGVGHARSWSAPVPILRLPTEREQRRTMFVVAFDAAHIEH